MADLEVDFFFIDQVELIFTEVGLVNCINCNPVPRGTRNHSHEALLTEALASADSGLQLDLGIALNDVSAKSSPCGLIQPCRKQGETSDDVIEDDFTSTPDVVM